MFSIQMPRITFFLRNGILYCRVSFLRTTSEFSTNERLDPQSWDQSKQQYIGKSKQHKKFIDTLIESISYKLKTIALLSDIQSAKELIHSMLPKPVSPNKNRITLRECLKKYIQEMSTKKSSGTLKGYNTKLNNLIQFEKYIGSQFYILPESDNENFNLPMAEKFKEWFRNTRKTENVSTASRNIELYVNAMKLAMKQGQIKTFDLIVYAPERDAIKAPIVLNPQEIGKVKRSVFESELLSRVLDLYFFQCSTGLSFGDLWSWQLKETEIGLAITGYRTKSKQMYFVPLTTGARMILEKYKGEIPQYSNQVYNRALKTIANTLNISKKLTSHSGRKTFATLMDQEGWSIESIARMLGHSSIKTTESYYIQANSRRVELEFLTRQTKKMPSLQTRQK